MVTMSRNESLSRSGAPCGCPPGIAGHPQGVLRRGLLVLLFALRILVLPGWADGAQSPVVTIYVVSHGWHTGIVVPRREIPKEFWDGGEDYSAADFLEFGWGDAEFYQEESPAFWRILTAAILPSDAVLHVVAFTIPVTEFFPVSGVVAIELPRDALYRLSRFLDETILKSRVGAVVPLGAGLYGRSRFYAAQGNYTLFNNCNHWVARGLNIAGLPVDPTDAMTASAVFDQVARFGTILRKEP